MYNFSDFTCSLNEPEEGVAPTDSRLRPDQRVMELQDFDKANDEKVSVIMEQSYNWLCNYITSNSN